MSTPYQQTEADREAIRQQWRQGARELAEVIKREEEEKRARMELTGPVMTEPTELDRIAADVIDAIKAFEGIYCQSIRHGTLSAIEARLYHALKRAEGRIDQERAKEQAA